ncbi:MAG TPA: hypothetical protein VHW09_10050 [Bryobacteraceae bacterium]|jgi:hypothetical protein|nr:hypothetical protein [Bryobacteraceae bacterium]
MPARISPQLRFLLRGSGLFIVLLAAWWWLLLSPMMAGLRGSTRAVLWLLPGGRSASGVTVQPDGDWLLRVPLPQFLARQDAVQRAYGRRPGAPPVNVRSFQLVIADRIPTFFTLGFPLFWALVLAAPRSRHLWKVLAQGTALLAVLAQASLLLYMVYSIENTLRLATSALAVALWNGVEYLNVNVVPYAAPLLLAAWLHVELRAQIFLSGGEMEAAPALEVEEKTRRGKYRARK